MSAATVWRWLRGELLGIAILGLLFWGLHSLDPLGRVRFTDILAWVAVWFVLALVRTGFGALWRRRRARNPQPSDESTLSRS